MYLDDLKQENCSGCMACRYVCPAEAIRWKADAHGFSYPEIDREKCVDCGQCRNVCPSTRSFVGQDADPAIYAVRNKQEDVLSKSSSGGMFTILAEWILEQGGCIYGVAFDPDFSVRHRRASSYLETERFRTSKYVESNPSEIYKNVLADLEEGRTVLVTGTPCQIAGVTSWLKEKRADCTKLYTCDNICHGVPSHMVWKDYLEMLETKYISADDEIMSVNMRSKRVSWKEQKFEVDLKNGDIGDAVEKISFNKLFLSLSAHRPSCFACRFTSYQRVADFTLGDFWNAENAGVDFDIEKGVNEVFVNTAKGELLFEMIRRKADVQPISKKAAWQPYLEYSGKKPSSYDKFWEEYLEASDKEPVIRKYIRGSFVTRVIHALSPLLRKTGLYNLAGRFYRTVFVRGKKH